jgi:hypothetical protein
MMANERQTPKPETMTCSCEQSLSVRYAELLWLRHRRWSAAWPLSWCLDKLGGLALDFTVLPVPLARTDGVIE